MRVATIVPYIIPRKDTQIVCENRRKIKKCKFFTKICTDYQILLILAKNFRRVMAKVISKKRLVTSFNNLSQELQEAVKELYPAGFSDAMMRVDKPNGDFFYAVPFETEEISYLVKIDVKIDDLSEEEDDKDYYDDEIKGADDLGDDMNHGEDEMSDDDITI